LIKQQKIEKPCEDESVIQFEKTIEMLGASGFEQYEISNYAQKGFESRHNTNYWFGQLLQRPNFRGYSSQFKIESVILVASFSQKVALMVQLTLRLA
jgi:hypothetical protein